MSHFDDVALPAICLPRLRLHYSSFSPSGGQAQWWAEQRVAVRRSQSVGKQWLYPPLVRFSTGEFQLFTLMVADGRGEGDGARSRGRSLASSGADERGRSLASSGMDRARHLGCVWFRDKVECDRLIVDFSHGTIPAWIEGVECFLTSLSSS